MHVRALLIALASLAAIGLAIAIFEPFETVWR
jgi:hypothetical protein